MKQRRWAVSRRAARALAAIVLAGCVASLDAQDTEFAPHLIFFQQSAVGSSVLSADIDSDGDLDIVMALTIHNEDFDPVDARSILLLENDGLREPGFKLRNLTENIDDFGTRLLVGDIDSDGDLDILNAKFHPIMYWLENDGRQPSNWMQRTAFSLPFGFHITNINRGDVDRDGDLDLFVGIELLKSGGFSWAENLGGSPPEFTLDTIKAAPVDLPTHAFHKPVFVADFNGDGFLDTFTETKLENVIRWWENDGMLPPFFTSHIVESSEGPPLENFHPILFQPADFNGDSAIDILAADSRRIVWLKNVQGNGLTWSHHDIASGLGGVRSIAAVDLDLDGDVDVIASAFDDDTIWWFANPGVAGAPWTQRALATSAGGIVTADLDGDGDLDVISISRSSDAIFWHENLLIPTNGASPAWRLYK